MMHEPHDAVIDGQRTRDVNLRWEPTPEERARRADPLEAAGIDWNRTQLGDPYDLETRRREQAKRQQKQSVRHELTIGSTVILRDGTKLGEGEEITPEILHPERGRDAIARLEALGIVSSIDPHTAYLRSLDESVGPYVVVAETLQVGDRTLARGEAVSESMFPPLVLPRKISDETPLGKLTAADLRRLCREEIDKVVPRPDVPPPRSEFHRAIGSGAIELAPNWRKR